MGVKSLFLFYLQSYEFHVKVMFLFCFSLISLGTLEWILFNPFSFHRTTFRKTSASPRPCLLLRFDTISLPCPCHISATLCAIAMSSQIGQTCCCEMQRRMELGQYSSQLSNVSNITSAFHVPSLLFKHRQRLLCSSRSASSISCPWIAA